jgi:hypothetical protein
MLKKLSLIAFVVFATTLFSNAQILISQQPSGPPNPSAQFEVRSNQKGFLPPVMSTNARRAIVNPAEGLMVFDSTKQLMFVFTKAGWQSFNITLESLGVSDGTAFPNPGFIINDLVGYQVEILNDVSFLGAATSTISGKSEQGAVYMYKFENGAWNFKVKITAADGQAGDNFGNDISATGDYVFIAASGDSYSENAKQGSVYIYKWIDNILTYQSKITGSNATSGDGFGSDIEAKGNLLVVAATLDDINANTDQGSVYFFEREGDNWVEKQKYFASANVGTNNLFGKGIVIDSNFVGVGCSHLNTPGNYGFNRNRISIFSRTGGIGDWGIHSEIVNPTEQNFEAFGYALTLKDSILTVSANMRDIPNGNKDRGAVYVYRRNGISWNLIQTIAPTDSSNGDSPGDYLGVSSDRDGNFLIVGSHHEDFGAGQNNYGGAFIYEWNGTQFVELKKLRSASPQIFEWFGTGVAIHNGKIVVGAPRRNSNTGAGYFFKIE